MTIEMGNTYVEPGADAFDRYNLDEELLAESNNELEPGLDPIDILDRTLPVTITGIVNTSVPGTYTRTYSATDSSGNTTTVTRTVIVENNQNPTITLSGDNPLTLDVDTDYVEPGSSATDALGTSINVITSSNINNEIVGNYTVTYTAADSYGNTGTASRIIYVRDRISPVITLNGNSSISLDLNDSYFELGATAVDNYDNSVSVVTTGIVNTSVPGTYTRTYSATDSSGNTSTKTRTITVTVSQAPVISIQGDNPTTSNVGLDYIDPELLLLML